MSFLSMCIQSSPKTKKEKKHHNSRRAPSRSVAPVLSQLVPTNIQQLDEPIVRKNPFPALKEDEHKCAKPALGRAYTHHHASDYHTHPNSENCSSTSNDSQYTSGYQTDDGTFEGKMLHLATESRPANLRMTAVKDYNPCCDEELVLRKGQRVKVLHKNNDWVYAVTKTGEAGYIPYNFVRPSRKYAGYQSEPEYAPETDVYQSGYDTDMPVSGERRYGGARAHIDTVVPAYSIHTGYRNPPTPQQYRSQQHGTRLGSSGSGGYSPPTGPPPTHRFRSGYTSAVEYPTTQDLRRHPRPAQSLHSIVDSESRLCSNMDRRPSEGKPGIDSFTQEFLEELVVIHDFEAQEEDEAFINKGEKVKVMNADDPFWLWVETALGLQGFVPRACCSLGNHPYLQSNSTRRYLSNKSRNTKRLYYQKSKAQIAARQVRSQAKQRFHELARQRNNSYNPVLMDKGEIQRVGSKLIVLMDYTATQKDEISIQFAETVYADVLKQAGAERIWAYCPRTEECGFVPVSLVVPPVV